MFAHSPPDGYVLYMSPSTTTSMHVVRKTMPYDVRKAFTPVTQVVVLPQALKVQPISDFGNPSEIARLFGGPQAMREAVAELTEALYAA